MKKHTWKRTLALLMMLAMLLNLTPVSVFADDPPDPVDITVEEEVPQGDPLPEDILISPVATGSSQSIAAAISGNGHAYVVSNSAVEVFRDPEMTLLICTVRKSGTIYYVDSYAESVSVWFADQDGNVLNGFILGSALEDMVIDDADIPGMTEYGSVSASVDGSSVILFTTDVEYPDSEDKSAESIPPETPDSNTDEDDAIISETDSPVAEEEQVTDPADPSEAPEESSEDSGDETGEVSSSRSENVSEQETDPVDSSIPEDTSVPENSAEGKELSGNEDLSAPETTVQSDPATFPDPDAPEIPEDSSDDTNSETALIENDSVPGEEEPPTSESLETDIGKEEPEPENTDSADFGETNPEETVENENPDILPEDLIISPETSATVEIGGFAEIPADTNLYNCQGSLCGVLTSRAVVLVERADTDDSGESRYLVRYWSDTIESRRVFAEGYVYSEDMKPTGEEDYILLEKEKVAVRKLRMAKRGYASANGYARIGGFRKGRITDSVLDWNGTLVASGAYLWDNDGNNPIPMYVLNGSNQIEEDPFYGFFRVEGASAKATVLIGNRNFIPGRAYTMQPHPVQYIYAFVGDTDRKGTVVQEGDTVTFYSAWTGEALGTAKAGEAFEYNDYVFDVFEAKAFAEAWWDGPEQVEDNDCATFASAFACAGALTMYSAWASKNDEGSDQYNYSLVHLADILLSEHAVDPDKFVESGTWNISGDVTNNCTVTVPMSCPVEAGDIVGVGDPGNRHHMMVCVDVEEDEDNNVKRIHLYAHSSGAKDRLTVITDVVHLSMFAVEYEVAPRKGSVQLIKKDDAGNAMSGVSFTLSSSALNYSSTKKTDSNGAIEWTDLEPGKYVLEESTPAGYEITSSQEITVSAGSSISVAITNYRLGSVKLKKQDDAGNPMKNVSFTLSCSSLSYSSTKQTDANGIIEWTNLKPGDYTLEESTPSGYEIVSAQVVTVTRGTQKSVTVTNKRLGSVSLLKKDDSGNPMKSVSFTLSNSSYNFSSTKETDANGVIEWKDLKAGTYVLKETVPPGYEVTSSQNVTVEYGKATSLTVINRKLLGSVKVIKKDDSGNPMKDVSFTLSRADINYSVTKKTDAGGVAAWTDLDPGTYVLSEETPVGYEVMDPVNVTVEPDKETVKNIANILIRGSVSVTKYRKVMYDGMTPKTLAGALLELRKTGTETVVGTAKETNESGLVLWTEIPYGKYDIVEVRPPEGYQSAGIIGTVTVDRPQQTFRKDVVNEPVYGSVAAVKYRKGTTIPLAGATFELLDSTKQARAVDINGNETKEKTSDSTGVVRWDNIEYGTYYIRETKAPEGYQLDSTPKEVKVETQSDIATFDASDDWISGYIKIIKICDETEDPIPNAEFDILAADGSVADHLTTNASGEATSKALEYGDYTVVETYCPPKYKLNESTFPVSIREHGKTYSLTVKDKANYGWIELTKLDELDNHPIAGVKFEIVLGDNVVETLTTNAQGYAKSKDLVCGTYTVREKDNPTGYIEEISVTDSKVTPLKVNSLTFKNRPIQGKIRIFKSDELTKEALADAEFTVTRISGLPSHNGEGDGDVVAVMVTGTDGIAETELLTYGKYRVEETVVPEHFKDKHFSTEVDIVTDSKTEEIVYPVDVPNEPTPGWVRLKKTDRITGNPIPGIKFDVYRYVPGENQTIWEISGNREFVETITTDSQGVALSSPLLKGCYYVVEKGPTPGYLFEKVEFDGVIVKSDEVTPLTATNLPVQITISVYKRDDDLYNGPTPSSPAESLPEAVSIPAPEAHGDAKLTGAEFTIVAEEDILDRQGNVLYKAGATVVASISSSGSNASCKTAELFPGKYILKEINPPEGYEASDTEIHIDATYPAKQSDVPVVDYQALFLNTVRKGRYGLIKFYGDNAIHTDAGILENAEPNATFAVWLSSAGSYEKAREDERDMLVTNAFGKAKTKELPYGVYTIKQLSGKPGYAVKSPYNFRITGDEDPLDTPMDIINNEAYHYWLKIIKVDEETGKVITLSHARFKLKDESGQFITQEIHYPKDQPIDIFETDETGTVQLPETLLWGKYYVCEIESPQGYLINTKEIEVDVGAEADETYHVEVEIDNTPVKGNIVIDKTGLQLTGFETIKENGYSCEKPIFENRFLAGAVFEVYAAEDIVGMDGTMHYGKDQLVDTITTTSGGHDKSKDLPLGRYYVVEKSAPEGYVFSNERYEADLVYADDHTARVTAKVKAGNDYLKSELHLEKEKQILTILEQGDGMIHQVITRIPGEGFIFGLYNKNGITASGQTLPAGTLLAAAATDAEGKLVFSGYYPHDEYYVQELETQEGWKLNTDRFPVSLTPDLKAENENIIRVGLPEKVLNEIIYRPVTITKTDLTEKETIPGALIEVYDEAGVVIYREYTDENGEIPDIPVRPGKYTFKEILSPEGYALNTAVMEFEVNADGNVTGDTVIRDDFTRVMFTKHDTDGEIMEGVEFTLFDETRNAVMTARSDKNGLVTFEKIPFGKFTIEETRTLDGYIRKTGTLIMFTVDGTFVNSGKPAGDIRNTPNEIRLKKVDQDGNILPGAEFGLFDGNGTQIMTALSDENGIVLFRKMPAGEYTVRETKPVDGYLLCKTEYRFTVDDDFHNSAEPSATFVNHLKRLKYIKTDTSGKFLAGVEFSLIDKTSGETVETVVSDEKGVFTFTKFDYGDWIISETKVPDGFNRMADIELHVGDDWTEPAPFTCVNIPDHFEFLKIDNEGNPMPGVTFTLEDAEGNIIRDLVSGEDGIVHVTNLTPGRYVIRELETLEGFTLNEDAIVVEINEKYVIPEEMFTLINYPVIQTGVELSTPFWLLGSFLVGFSLLNIVTWVITRIRKRKKQIN